MRLNAFSKPLGFLLLFLSTQTAFSNKIAQAQTQVSPATTTKTICPAQLGTSIDAVINRPLFSRARWGILVQPLSSVQTLYSTRCPKILYSSF